MVSLLGTQLAALDIAIRDNTYSPNGTTVLLPMRADTKLEVVGRDGGVEATG